MNIKDVAIMFMGSSKISAKVLMHMLERGFNIVALVSQPNREKDRKGNILDTPTKAVADHYHVPVYQIEKLKNDYSFINDVKPELILSLSYGQIVPHDMLVYPKYGALNLHGSDLPKYRGASPIQTAILNGDKLTAMSLMEMADKMDAGKVYYKRYIDIEESDNSSSLFNKMADAGCYIVDNALQDYIDNKLVGVIQDEALVSYTHMIKKEDEKIDLSKSVLDIKNQIRALSDTPGAYLLLDEQKIKIYTCKVYSNDIKGQVGEILAIDKNHILLQCKDGVLDLLELQLQGKKRLLARDFANGNKNLLGSVLK